MLINLLHLWRDGMNTKDRQDRGGGLTPFRRQNHQVAHPFMSCNILRPPAYPAASEASREQITTVRTPLWSSCDGGRLVQRACSWIGFCHRRYAHIDDCEPKKQAGLFCNGRGICIEENGPMSTTL